MSAWKPAVTSDPAASGADLPGRVLLDLRFDSRSLFTLRSAVTAHATAAGLSRQQVYDVTAVAHELAANAIRHGAGHGRLRLLDDNGCLYCQVTDSGPARDTPAPGDGLPWAAEYDRGLWIARQVTTKFRIQHGPAGTTATARFPAAPFSRPAATSHDQGGQPPPPASLSAPGPGPEPPPLTIGVREDHRWMTVLVEGHLDYLTGTDLIMVLGGLISDGKLSIAVDLSRAALADSSGLRCLLRASRQVRARGGELIVIDDGTGHSPGSTRLRDLGQAVPVLPAPPG
jgi:anti-sigma regulatory factor (Ser/Thr protein kinase)/ABC-type transporter Mla MlaB component